MRAHFEKTIRRVIASLVIMIFWCTTFVSGIYYPKVAYAEEARVFSDGSIRTSMTIDWGGSKGEENFGEPRYFREDNNHQLFCIDPAVDFHPGQREIVDLENYRGGLSRRQITVTALGVDYIMNRCNELDQQGRSAITQMFIWSTLSQHWEDGVFNKVWSNDSRYPVSLVDEIIEKAKEYGEKNADDYVGRGIVYVDKDSYKNSQSLCEFSVENVTGYCKIRKETSGNEKLIRACSNEYSLEGAKYGVYKDEKLSEQIGTLVTGKNGVSDNMKLRAGNYYIKEMEAPRGFKLNEQVYKVAIKQGEVVEFVVKDEPILPDIDIIMKKKAYGQEGASVYSVNSNKDVDLSGAEYRVNYYQDSKEPVKSWIFKTDREGMIKLNNRYKVNGDSLFEREDGKAVLLPGHYSFKEVKSPKGFKLSGNTLETNLTINNETYGFNYLEPEDIEYQKPLTIKLKKRDFYTNSSTPYGFGSLRDAKYQVSYIGKDGKEVVAGIITIDNNGEGSLGGLRPGNYKVREIKAPRGYTLDKTVYNCNCQDGKDNELTYYITSRETPKEVIIHKKSLNDQRVSLEGAEFLLRNLDENKVLGRFVSKKEGIKIYGLGNGKYQLEEVKAPKGYMIKKDKIEFTVGENDSSKKIEVFNMEIPKIKSLASFNSGLKNGSSNKVQDKIILSNLLKEGRYVVEGELVDLSSKKLVAKSISKFTSSKAEGTLDLTYILPKEDFAGKTFVSTVKLYLMEGSNKRLVAEEVDYNNKEQQVYFPKLDSIALNGEKNIKEVLGSGKVEVVDKVMYENAIVGRTYKMEGQLMDKKTHTPIRDRFGRLVLASTTFVPSDRKGEVKVKFNYEGEKLEGKTISVFEKMTDKGVTVASHAGYNIKSQQVSCPQVKTLAFIRRDANSKSEEKKKKAFIEGRLEVEDLVKVENLKDKGKYTLKAELVEKKSKKTVSNATSSFDFTGEQGEVGSCKVVFDCRNIKKGGDYVVFEEVYKDGVKIGEHKQLDSKEQTVSFVEKPKPPKTGDKKKYEGLLALAFGFSAVVAFLRLITRPKDR